MCSRAVVEYLRRLNCAGRSPSKRIIRAMRAIIGLGSLYFMAHCARRVACPDFLLGFVPGRSSWRDFELTVEKGDGTCRLLCFLALGGFGP